MRLSGTRTGELLDAVAARCERLVHGSVREPAERLRQRRLIGVMLAAPLLIAAPAAILLPPLVGAPAMLAGICAIFGAAFLIALLVAATGRAFVAEAIALVLGAVALAGVVASAGGPASPAAIVLAALPFEAWWVRRTPKAALAGAAAALATLPLQAVLGPDLFAGASPAAAHWLIPLGYLAFVVPRLVAWLDGRVDEAADEKRPLEEIVEAVVLRMDAGGEVLDASPAGAQDTGPRARASLVDRPVRPTACRRSRRLYVRSLRTCARTKASGASKRGSGCRDRRARPPATTGPSSSR